MRSMIDKIIHGDCLEVMPEIPDGSIDAILCDLPYGTTACKWDTIIPFEPLWEQYRRIIKPNGAIVLTASQPFTTKLIASNLDMFKYELIWDKVRPSGHLNANRMPLRSHENILVFYNRLPLYKPQYYEGEPTHQRGRMIETKTSSNYGKYKNVPAANNGNKKYPKSILRFIKPHPAIHPTQKSEDCFEYLIKTYTNENEIVLDNCIGSGTTAIAAIRTDRHFIGIEKSAEYCLLARNRIRKEGV